MAKDEDIVREAKERYERCVDWESKWRARALFDQRFALGDAQNGWQWDGDVRADRTGRPCLTQNHVRQHNLQIVNDARQNKAQIKITPTSGKASYDAAQVMSGVIRRIEYQSKAIDAYSTAIYHQVETGIGYVRVDTGYVDDDTFNLDLFIRRIADPRTVYIDPDCQEYDKSDASFAFIFEDIPRDRYEEEHGKDAEPAPNTLENNDGWNAKDHVRVAEYWRRTTKTEKRHRLNDGTVTRDSEIPDELREQIEPLIEKTREVVSHKIEWFKLSGDKIVDREEWLGRYIPIVPFIGEESVVDRVMDRKGHTRSQIDAQRIYNYWASAAVEQVALQTKTPYVARADAIQGREEQWKTANIKNHSVLIYNALDEQGNPIQRPEREPPPTMAQAYVEGMQIARQDLMSVTGQYQAELGMPSNERSGVAIQQRQRQGDTAVYHYIDNQSKAIRQVGRILLDLIPKIYDTPRVVKIMGYDNSESTVQVDPNAPDAHQSIGPNGAPLNSAQAQAMRADPDQPNPGIIFNPSVGEYSVEADVGPPFGTMRQEAANAFAQIMSQNPAAFQIVGDFWAQNSDFPGADELAARLKRGLPPQYQGVDLQVQQMQAAAREMQNHAQQLLTAADGEIAALKQQVAAQKLKLEDKSGDRAIDDYKAETDRLKAVGQIDPTSLQIIVRQMVEQMLQTDLEPMLHRHADVQGTLAARMAPPEPAEGEGGAPAPPAPAPAPPPAPVPAMAS